MDPTYLIGIFHFPDPGGIGIQVALLFLCPEVFSSR